jgi:glycosyltransferase involved in cell wall biosynthesis
LRTSTEQRKLRAVTIRVLHVDTEKGWRGGERQALWLAVEMRRRGHTSVVAARLGEPMAIRAAEAGLAVVDCQPATELDPRAAWRLRRDLLAWRIGVVHAHTAHAVAIGALATLGTGVPLVVSRRVDFPLRANVGTRWKYGRAASIVAVSNAVANVLVAGGIARDRIAVVPDGVDLRRVVEPASAATLAACGVAPNRPLVVQVAQLVGHKDPVNFVRAMAYANRANANLQALLVGDGPLRGEVTAEIQRLSLADVIHLTGYRADADSLLAAATVACLSSREEGMGSVLLDAMAFGRPIAATTAGGIPEVVLHEETGLLADRGNPEALGAAIVRLVNDRTLAERLAKVGRRWVLEFSVERMTDRMVEIYERVTADRDASNTERASTASSDSSTVAP